MVLLRSILFSDSRNWRLSTPDSFLTISIQAKDLMKGSSGGNVNKLCPDETKMSARQWKRESYTAIPKQFLKDFSLNLPAPQRVLWDLVRPITEGKMRRCLKGVSGTAGLDGLTWVQVKKGIQPASLAAHYNNNWIVRRD